MLKMHIANKKQPLRKMRGTATKSTVKLKWNPKTKKQGKPSSKERNKGKRKELKNGTKRKRIEEYSKPNQTEYSRLTQIKLNVNGLNTSIRK